MKRILILPWLLAWSLLPAQVSLDQVMQAARQQSPQAQQPILEREVASLEDERLARAWLPQVGLHAQATYQSDVITFPENPMFSFPELPQAQYRATLDVQQPIYDGGRIAQARQLNWIGQQVASQQTEVALAGLDRQVTQQFFAVLQAQQQQSILASSLEYLAEQRESLQSGVDQGVLLPGDLASLDQRVLTLQQQLTQLQAAEQAQRQALAVLTSDVNMLTADLLMPEPASSDQEQVQRPELQAFALQQNQMAQQGKVLQRQLRPSLAAFASVGVGQPNPYNFLETDFDGFYMVGLRLNWAPWDWHRTKRQQQQLSLRQEQVDLSRQSFTQGLQAQLVMLDAQIVGLAGQMEQDEQLLNLQQGLVDQAAQQLELGTRTSSDYLREVDALTRARQQQALRQLQLRQLQVQRAQLLGQ